MLVKLLFLQHPDFVIRCIHAPILDVNVELGEVKVRPNGVPTDNAKALIVTVANATSSEPLRDEALAVGLDEGPGLGGDSFVEFDLGVKITAIQIHLVEA